MTASDLMAPKLITITSNDPLSKAAELMIKVGIRGPPVTEPKGKVRGIVTKTDIVRAIAK